MNELIINLDDTERVKSFDKNELFQLDAYVQVEKIIRNAFTKIERINRDITPRIGDCRTHNAIFISGKRGTGKTAFLVNIGEYISKNWAEEKKPASLKPIDPTILEENDHFLSIVIGHVVEYVEEQINDQRDQMGDTYQEYYRTIDLLSQSLRAARTIDEAEGIEEIVSSQNSLKLEQNVHAFFKAACDLIRIPFIVLAIDDIDMSFEKGFQILETVRKYMASPYVIPVISGDPALYHSILFQNFHRRLVRCDLEAKDLRKSVSSLTDKYLAKVFPAEYRIYLREIFDILRQRKTTLTTERSSCGYNIYKDVEIRVQNYRMNQKEFTNQIFEDNARSFIQYLVSKRELVKLVADNFEKAGELTEHKPFDPSDPIMPTIDAFIRQYIFAKDFSVYQAEIRKTHQLYALNTDKILVAKTAQNEELAVMRGRYSQYRQFKSDFFLNGTKPEFKPDREPLVSSLFIPKTGETAATLVRIRKKDSLFGLLCDVFTHDDFYSSYQTTKFLLAGRFLEIMLLSLDPPNLDDRTFSRILASTPYNANLNANKYVPLPDDESSDGDVVQDITDFNSNASVVADLIERITKWHAEHVENPLNGLNDIIPTHFVHHVTNKFFNNINVLKMGEYDSKKHLETAFAVSSRWAKESEPVIRFFQRVVYIFLNAVASFENPGRVSHTNIAVGKNFSGSNSLKSDNAYRLNIVPLEEAKCFSFTKAFSQHPLVTSILAYGSTTPITEEVASLCVGAKTIAGGKTASGTKSLVQSELTRFQRMMKGYSTENMDENDAIEFIDEMFQYLFRYAARMSPEDKEEIREYIDKRRSKPQQALLKLQNVDNRMMEYDKLISPLA
jgi:hypothetical protein